ncbi:MAG: hypothetical protein DHS20C05_09060 [Hyphococcus sp.]|nr:MAG: hypothetical protein DHS20C05_09060 [Marinicaulis sp.]
MLPSVMIIDDFLSDPSAAREQALALDYDPQNKRGKYPGHISTEPLNIKGLSERVSRLINTPVLPAPDTIHGHCRITLKGDKGRSGVHIDPAFYSGILFLSLPQDCKGGTDFFRHKHTGLERLPSNTDDVVKAGYSDINALIEGVVNKDTLSTTKWERTMRIPMRFNRLILFSPWMFHNSAAAFGVTKENGRLVNLMFFAKA